MKWLHRVLGLVVVLGLHNGVHAQEAVASGEYSIAARFTIDSKILGEKREVLISVPQGYEESRDTFPVHILLDGEQNIEHAVASTRLQSQWSGLPKSIIVAIPSVDRTRDFTPSQDINYSRQSGGAFQFNLVGNNLIGQRQGWADFRLFPEGNDRFYTRSLGLAPSYQFKESGVDVLAYGQAYPYAKVACE